MEKALRYREIYWNEGISQFCADGVALDGDNPEHIQWVFQKSLERAAEFNITGVTYRLTQGNCMRGGWLSSVISLNSLWAHHVHHKYSAPRFHFWSIGFVALIFQVWLNESSLLSHPPMQSSPVCPDQEAHTVPLSSSVLALILKCEEIVNTQSNEHTLQPFCTQYSRLS